MDGFTIKCNRCGKETAIDKDFNRDNDSVIVTSYGYDGETMIYCECGNEATD